MEEEIALEKLKSFFENYNAPLPQAVQLGAGVKVIDVSKFIASSLSVITEQENNPTYGSFKADLVKLKALLSAPEIQVADKERTA